MKKLILILLLLLPCVGLAQGVPFSSSASPITNGLGQPIAGVTISVCTAAATIPPTCGAPVTIYKDAALTTPYTTLTTDGFGNFYFFIAPASNSYCYTTVAPPITGTVCQPFSVPIAQGSSPTFAALTVTGNVSVGGTLGAGSFYKLIVPSGDLGAQVNTAIAAFGSSPGTVAVADGGGTCTTTIALTSDKQHIDFGAGTYNCLVRLPDSASVPVSSAVTGHGKEVTFLKAPNSINADVIADSNFASFTGGANFFGTFSVTVSDLTIDCNKANNSTAGYALRIYGRGWNFNHVRAQNCHNDGIWTEWGGAESDTAPNTTLESHLSDVEVQYNDNNGYTQKGPNDVDIAGLKCHNNGAWGWDTFLSSHGRGVNCYENVSGGIHAENGSSINGSDIAATTATGFGMLSESGAGLHIMTASTWSGPIGLEVRGSAGSHFDGLWVNTTTTGINLNGAGANESLFTGAMFNNTGAQVQWTSGGAFVTFILNGTAPGGATLSGATSVRADNTTIINIVSTPSNLTSFQLGSALTAPFVVFPGSLSNPSVVLNGTNTGLFWDIGNSRFTFDVAGVDVMDLSTTLLTSRTVSMRMVEMAAPAGIASSDIPYADSTAHRLKMNNNNTGAVTIGTIPLFNAAGTESLGAPHAVQDTCTLGTSCGVTLSGSAAYTNSTSYTCTCEDDTAIAACRVNQTAGNGFTITGTGTDVIRYQCVGN